MRKPAFAAAMALLSLIFSNRATAQDAESNLQKLQITLPPAAKPVASYVNAVRVGNLLYLSGKGPQRADGSFITGKLGRNMSIDSAYAAARITAVSHLAVLKAELGSLNRVKRVVKVLGLVNCTDDFPDEPKVINGYSDLMVAVFGEKGKHARSAIGVSSLPFNMCVEVEVIVEVED